MISSAAGPNFVSKCSEDIQRMLVSPEVTLKETEERVIVPYLRIMEDASIPEDGRNAALEAAGLHDSGSVGAGYGVSKAALNAYTVEVARTNPGLSSRTSPGGRPGYSRWISPTTCLSRGVSRTRGLPCTRPARSWQPGRRDRAAGGPGSRWVASSLLKASVAWHAAPPIFRCSRLNCPRLHQQDRRPRRHGRRHVGGREEALESKHAAGNAIQICTSGLLCWA